MQRVIIDSDLLSDLVKLKNPNVEAKANEYQLEHTAITFISLSALEILSGLKPIDAPSKLRRAEMLLAENDEILPTVQDYRFGSGIVSASCDPKKCAGERGGGWQRTRSRIE